MKAIEKRDFIHSNLHLLNDADIDEMYKIVQSIIKVEPKLSEVQEKELEYRTQRHKNGESKSYTWEEVKRNLDL